jgi:hypothetical protein
VHELGHRILLGSAAMKAKRDTVFNHKCLFLGLYDVLIDLYGEDFAKETAAFEKNFSVDYKTAWDWALQFDREERMQRFAEILNGDFSKLD